jgi:hypothetical protein
MFESKLNKYSFENLFEATDRTSPVYKYYKELKAMSVNALRQKMEQTHKIVSTVGMTKDDMVNDLLYAKHNKKQIHQTFGITEDSQDSQDDRGLYMVRCYSNFWDGIYYENGIDSLFVLASDSQEAQSIAKNNIESVLTHFKNKRVGPHRRPGMKKDNTFIEIRNAKLMPTQRSHNKVLQADGTVGPVNLDESDLHENFSSIVNKKLSRKSEGPQVNSKYATGLNDNDLEDLIATSTGNMKAAAEAEQQRRKSKKRSNK